MTKFCQLWLTVSDKKDADKIVNTLLDKHLVACARQMPVSSDYWWQGKKEHSEEILLMMESAIKLFPKVETEVQKLHSYDAFVLEATPVERISAKALEWLEQELK